MKTKSKPEIFNAKDYGTCMVVGHTHCAEKRDIVFIGESVGDPVAIVTSRYFVGNKPVEQTLALRMSDNKGLYSELRKEFGAQSFTKLIFAVCCFIAAFQACRKDEQPTPSIAGNWRCQVCVNPNQTWVFEDSTEIAVHTWFAVGNEVFTNKYHYSQSGDTIRFFHIGNYSIMKWAVRFEGDSVLNVKQVGAMMQPIQYLKRTK
jgi:hypothetical protein